MTLKLLGSLSLFFIFAACATKPIAPQRVSEKVGGQWEAKALLKEVKTDKKYYVDLDMIARDHNHIRMEISGPFGISVASIVINEEKLSYLLPQEKKFFTGNMGPQSLKPVFSVAVDPHLFQKILFEKELDSQWKCEKDQDQFLKQCMHQSGQLKIIWSERNGHKKRVVISHSQYEMNLYFSTYKNQLPSKVQGEKSLFELVPPSDFKTYKLN